MPKCSACGTGMALHDDGFFDKVWKCPSDSSHPTITTRGDGAKAVVVGGAVLTGVGVLSLVVTGGASAPLVAKGVALIVGGSAAGSA